MLARARPDGARFYAQVSLLPCFKRKTIRSQVSKRSSGNKITPNLPTKIIPTKICRLELSGKISKDLGIPPLEAENVLESTPPKSRFAGSWIDRRAPATPRRGEGHLSFFIGWANNHQTTLK